MKERAQLPPKHTFSPLPGFFDRKREIRAIERALSGVPTFNVFFGASSVGKTALCRQVLTQPQFHVLHYDLRIAGFADLASLYFALASQMEQYFVELSKRLEGYEDFEKESYAFKVCEREGTHDALASRVKALGSPCLNGLLTVGSLLYNATARPDGHRKESGVWRGGQDLRHRPHPGALPERASKVLEF